MEAERSFEQITTEYLAELYEAQPVMATGMGVHEYDGLLPNFSKYAVADDLRRARAYLHRIDKLSLVQMSPDDRIDYRLARSDTQVLISLLEQVRPHQRQPTLYVDTALNGVYLLMARDFADVETRAASALCRLRGIPDLFRQAQENLERPPSIFTRTAMEMAEGGQTFFAEAVPAFAERIKSDALKKELLDANQAALAALGDFIRFLKEDLLPRSDGDFALGKELFDYHLRVGHYLDETSDDLVEIGREALEATRTEMARLSAEIDPERTWSEIIEELKQSCPKPTELVDCYAAEMARAREFVVLKRLVDLPPNESLIVTETPAFQRSMLPYAAYVPPAPFEAQQQGIFWVTPIDTSRSPEEQAAQLRGHSRFRIMIIALHEAYPGHHLQLTRANQVPSRFRLHFARSNLLIEGWALYCEEMMHEMGFYGDPRVRLMQLKEQLWRACRVIIDAQLHTHRMTPDEAVQLLVNEAHLELPNAWAEVKRYALTPTQPMSYLMGKRLLRELREKLERRQGARFDLRRFHNELLSYGSVPPRLVRESMLRA